MPSLPRLSPCTPPPEVGVGNRADPPGIFTQTVGLQPSGKSPPGCEREGRGGRARTSQKGREFVAEWVVEDKDDWVNVRGSLVRGEALRLFNLLPSQKLLPPHSLLSLSFTIKGNGTEPGWGRGLGWAGLGCCSGAVRGNGSQLLCGRGGPGPGDACASLSQRKLQELLWGWNSGSGYQLDACVQSKLGCTMPEWPSLAWDHQFVLHAPAQ